MNDGGPAFPQWDGHAITSEPMYLRGGMSLRDWFAGMAIQGILSANKESLLIPEGSKNRMDGWCAVAYEVADEMLSQRDHDKQT